MLIQVVIDWARANKFKAVNILPAEQNVWYRRRPGDNKDLLDQNRRLYIRYDVTATRMGFKYNKRLELYVLSLR